MPPLLDSILGKFPPLGVSSVSHDHLRAFIHLVDVPPAVFLIPDNNAYDTLSVSIHRSTLRFGTLLVEAEMWL